MGISLNDCRPQRQWLRPNKGKISWLSMVGRTPSRWDLQTRIGASLHGRSRTLSKLQVAISHQELLLEPWLCPLRKHLRLLQSFLTRSKIFQDRTRPTGKSSLTLHLCLTLGWATPPSRCLSTRPSPRLPTTSPHLFQCPQRRLLPQRPHQEWPQLQPTWQQHICPH